MHSKKHELKPLGFWIPYHYNTSAFRSRTSPWVFSCKKTSPLRYACLPSWCFLRLSHQWLWCPQWQLTSWTRKTSMSLALHILTWGASPGPVLQTISSCEYNNAAVYSWLMLSHFIWYSMLSCFCGLYHSSTACSVAVKILSPKFGRLSYHYSKAMRMDYFNGMFLQSSVSVNQNSFINVLWKF